MVVDDSKLVLQNVERALMGSGYRVVTTTNGQKALDMLESIYGGNHPKFSRVDGVITDVEMPQMNGITLTQQIRESLIYGSLPVLLHTSLSGEATKEAAQTAGANGYVVKNDIACILNLLGEALEQNRSGLS